MARINCTKLPVIKGNLHQYIFSMDTCSFLPQSANNLLFLQHAPGSFSGRMKLDRESYSTKLLETSKQTNTPYGTEGFQIRQQRGCQENQLQHRSLRPKSWVWEPAAHKRSAQTCCAPKQVSVADRFHKMSGRWVPTFTTGEGHNTVGY